MYVCVFTQRIRINLMNLFTPRTTSLIILNCQGEQIIPLRLYFTQSAVASALTALWWIIGMKHSPVALIRCIPFQCIIGVVVVLPCNVSAALKTRN